MSADSRHRGSVRLAITLIAAGLLAASGTGVWLLNGGESGARPAADAPRFKVARGNLRVTLRQTGTFEAEEALPVRADIRGSSKIVWLIDEGTLVKKDQVVVELDKTDVEKDIEQFSGMVEKGTSTLIAAQTDEEIVKLDCESKIRKSEIDSKMAELEVQKFNEQVRRKEVRDAEIKRDVARIKYGRLVAIDERMPKMLEQGFVTKEEVAQSNLEVLTAKNELETSEIELKILTEYTHPMQLERLIADRVRTKAEVERFYKELRRREAQTKAWRTQAEQELRRASEQLKDARRQLENMTVHAPSEGIVVYGSGVRDRNQEEIKLGTIAQRHLILMRLPNLNTMQVILQIHEADINKVRVGDKDPQACAISTDSMPGRTFDGYVKKVETVAQSNWFNRNVKWFSTTIGLTKQIQGIRPGTTAAVEILVDELSNILYVPIQSVQTRRGQSFCYVPVSGRSAPEVRPVVVGASNNNFVEIKEGLKEGEEILMVKPEVESPEGAPGEGSGPRTPYRRSRSGSGSS